MNNEGTFLESDSHTHTLI